MEREQPSDCQMTANNTGGRPAALDAFQRGRIVGLTAAGVSRREAAKAVGCHASTIGRTIARDAEFARQIAEAEETAYLRPLVAIQHAATRGWRAAAWVLERTRPDEFARRRPHTYTHYHVLEIVDRILEDAMPLIATEEAREALRLIADRYVEGAGGTAEERVNPLIELDKMAEELPAG